MQKIIKVIKIHKYSIVTLLLGASYFYLLMIAHDTTAGDYQSFVKSPVDLLYGAERWVSWSSRLFIENAVNIFSKNLFVWKISTMLSGALLFWSIGRLLGNRRISQSLVLFSILLLTNFYILTSAGIFATIINYLWPMACFTFVAAIIIRPFNNKALNAVSQIAIWPLYVFAMCSEQLAALGMVLCLGYVAYKLYNKQNISSQIWILFFLSVLGILNIILSPGNAIRTTQEIANWWVGFGDLSIVYKITVGTIVTFSRLFFAPELLAMLLVFSILVLSYVKRNNKAFISILPASTLTALFFFPQTAGTSITHLKAPNYFNEIREIALHLGPDNLANPSLTRIYILIFAILSMSIVASIIFLYGKTKKTFVILYTLGAGLVVSLAVSLSPTMFASNTRTLYPFVIILIYNNFIIIQDILNDNFNLDNPSTSKK